MDKELTRLLFWKLFEFLYSVSIRNECDQEEDTGCVQAFCLQGWCDEG